MVRFTCPHLQGQLLTLDELDRRIDVLHAEACAGDPVLVSVERATGESLTIGLGRDRSVLNYISASGDPPYFSAVGESADDEATVHFFYLGEWSEFPIKRLVPLDAARAAVRFFFSEGGMDPNVKWEEV